MKVIEFTPEGEKVVRDATPEEIVAAAERAKPTNAAVNAERDRRILAGTTITPAGHGATVRLTGDAETLTNLDALALAATLRMQQGDTTHVTEYRDADNIIHTLTPAQVVDLWGQGTAFVEACYKSSWTLKDAPGGIPADYTDDEHWPA